MAAVADLVHSPAWAQMLTVAARFTTYSGGGVGVFEVRESCSACPLHGVGQCLGAKRRVWFGSLLEPSRGASPVARHLPRVTFTSPQVAAVGMTDKQANAAGIGCRCQVLPVEYVPRALVNRDTRGFIKIVAVADIGRIVGITAVARDAGEIAAAGVYILEAAMTVQQVAGMWSPYLTMAEGIKIAARSFTTGVSKLSCCAA